MLKQITEESVEWQAAQGLSQERDLGARKKKDVPSQPQQAVQLAQLPMDPRAAYGDTGQHPAEQTPPWFWGGRGVTMFHSHGLHTGGPC